MHKKVVIALGGNAIQTTDGSSEAQKEGDTCDDANTEAII